MQTIGRFLWSRCSAYFVLHEMPFENDGVITWELMVERLEF